MNKKIFISHSCKDHDVADYIKKYLEGYAWDVFLDPFEPGDKTCIKTQSCIKNCSHFVLLLTKNSYISRWVRIESLFAQLCYDENSLIYIPVTFDKTPIIEPARELIHINWTSSNNIEKLAQIIAEKIHFKSVSRALKIDINNSKKIKEEGRKFERLHARTQDILYLHEAVNLYDKAIKLNFCNHNAWANLAWSLWKLREENRAWKYIHIAEDISPDSNQVKDVKKRMVDGKRFIL